MAFGIHQRVSPLWHSLSVVLIGAFLLRALIPAGWMPQASGTGDGITLVICTAAGLQKLILDPSGAPHPVDDSGQGAGGGADFCAFAAASISFTPPALSVSLLPLLASGQRGETKPAQPHAAPRYFRLAESRAPPSVG
jgi:hypothetical protein